MQLPLGHGAPVVGSGAGSIPLMVSVPPVPYASMGWSSYFLSGLVEGMVGRMKMVESELIGCGPFWPADPYAWPQAELQNCPALQNALAWVGSIICAKEFTLTPSAASSSQRAPSSSPT